MSVLDSASAREIPMYLDVKTPPAVIFLVYLLFADLFPGTCTLQGNIYHAPQN